MPKLTKQHVESLQPGNDYYIEWDSKITGFGVRVSPKGRKTYILKYRSEDGRQKRPRIGVHGNITCKQARDIAEDWHAERAKGGDPADERSELRSSPTVSELCDRFMNEHVRVHKKPRGIELDDLYIRKYIKPVIGTRKAISIEKQDIQQFHLSLRDMPAQANRMLATLSKMFNLAEEWGYRKRNTNPVEGIKKYKETKRERFLSNEELNALGETLEKAESEGKVLPHFAALIRLLLLTGARRGEIMHAKWEWVHPEAGLLILPDSKTGKKVIHLSASALEVLNNLERIKGNPYIIAGGNKGEPLKSPKKAWTYIRKRTTVELLRGDEDYGPLIRELEEANGKTPKYETLCEKALEKGIIDNMDQKPVGITDVRMHDLRHTYASICVNQGMTLQMVSKLLGHSSVKMSERYAHLAQDPVKQAASEAGDQIANVIGSTKKAQ